MKNQVIIFILIIVLIYYARDAFIKRNMIKVRSDIDNKMYVVKDVPDKQKAANMLARIRKNIFIITDYLIKNKSSFDEDMQKYVDQLNERIRGVVISEADGSSEYTSYSVNKGEEIVFCLRPKNSTNTLHDLNLVMYVVLHEISHVACPEYGHTKLFNKIFAFIATNANKIGLYKIIPFNTTPFNYCGLVINESVV